MGLRWRREYGGLRVDQAKRFFGVYLSWFVDVSSGATVVLLQAALFALALTWATARSRWRRRGAPETVRLSGLQRAVYE